MSDITSDVQETIDEIIRLGNGTIKDQIDACGNHLCTKFFPNGKLKRGISTSVIPLVLPTILKYIKSKNSTLQLEGVYFINAIASTPNQREHVKLVIEADVIPLLINNLSSKNRNLMDLTLESLGKIGAYYPRDVIENGILQPLYECLKSRFKDIFFQAVKCLTILLTNCEEKIPDVQDAEIINSLLHAVEIYGSDECQKPRYSLVNLLSPDFNDDAALESLKAIFNWLLTGMPKEETDYDLSERRKIEILLALKLIKNAIPSYGEAAVDIIERKNFLPPILKQIYGATKNVDIKIEAILVIDDIISVKPDFLLQLIDTYSIISLLSKNLSSKNEKLVATVLRTLKNAVEKCQDACRRKIKDFGSRAAYKKLREHKKKEISEPSKFINNFVNVKPAAAVDENDSEIAVIEQDGAVGDSRIASVERPQTSEHSRQLQKRAATDERPSTRSKKSKTSNESDDNEHSDSLMNDDDIGDRPGNSSPLNLDTVAAPAETNQAHQSFASSDDGTVRNGFNAGSPHGGDGNQLTGPPSSIVPDPGPEFASIRDVLTDIKPTPPVPIIEMVIPTDTTTTQNSTQNELPEHQSVAENVTAAADGTPPSNLNPRSSTSGNLSQSSSRHSSALPPLAATDRGTTSRNEIQPPLQPPGHLSPDQQNAEAAADVKLPNTLNPRSECSTSGNLSTSSRHSSTSTHHGTRSRHPRVKRESLSNDFHDPPSPTRPSNSPGLPEGSATDGRNRSPSQKPSRASLQFSAGTSRNNNYFAPFRYFYPTEEFISKCCEKNFGLKYNTRLHDKLFEFVRKIHIQHVGITSMPFVSHPTNDETGFGCISMLFTGSEDNAKIIREKISQKFAYYFSQSGNFDHNKLMEVTGEPYMLKCEHLETICRWLECRVMVYDEKWKLYGNWNGENTPLFLLEKKTIKGKEIYQVALSVETEVIDLD